MAVLLTVKEGIKLIQEDAKRQLDILLKQELKDSEKTVSLETEELLETLLRLSSNPDLFLEVLDSYYKGSDELKQSLGDYYFGQGGANSSTSGLDDSQGYSEDRIDLSEEIDRLLNDIKANELMDGSATKAGDVVKNTLGKGLELLQRLLGGNSVWKGILGEIVGAVGSALVYTDGISNTNFGIQMEGSWVGQGKSFLGGYNKVNSLVKMNNFTVRFMKTTPLDPEGKSGNSIYGKQILGAPYTFTHLTDPNDRTIINTLVKDSVFLSLTPGVPKFNGNIVSQEMERIFQKSGNYLNQTPTPDDMMSYIIRNGIDENFASKDRRYYTFKSEYPQYYSYLETMLNTVWTKMGLGHIGDNTYSFFSFFNIDNALAGNYDSTLLEKYKSSIGFFVEPSVSEYIDNSTTSFNSGEVDRLSESFQRINYLSGMGSSIHGSIRRIYPTVQTLVSESIVGGLNVLTDNDRSITKSIGKILTSPINADKDLDSFVQGFMVSNGMRLKYPSLWTDSSSGKALSFEFKFTSPYGDPLSIFQYVYVPFFALLTFALPRQSSENGIVSPFLVRADIPGLVTSDLAIINSISWVKGGDARLFTKDGLPREISGSFTIVDLFPYLSMTKRASFLSANPSYTVFLDNMSGVRAYDRGVGETMMDGYWRQILNRVSGEGNATSKTWNTYGQKRAKIHSAYAADPGNSKIGKTLNTKSVPWMRK